MKLHWLLAALLGAPGVGSAEPDMFRGGPAHLGVYESPASPGISTVKWRFKTRAKVLSSPAIDAGVVYIGSGDHNLYAVNSSDGTLRWKFRTEGAVHSSPAVSGGTVYFGSLDGNFYAVDTATGKEKWRFKTGGERRFTAPGIHGAIPHTEVMADPFDTFLSSPAIAEGLVYFGSGDHNVYALDPVTGAQKWKFATGDVVHASPAIAAGVLYIGSWDRNLYALTSQTGKMLWKFQTGDDTKIYNQIGIASSAAVADGTVFFGCRDGHFYAVDSKTGVQKWSHDNHMGWVIASPGVSGGKVYFPTSDGTRFKALEASSGKVLYDVANKVVSFSSPAITADTIYFGSSDGWLHALDIATGRIKAEFQTDGSKENSAKYIDDQGKFKGLYTDDTLDGMMVGMDRMYTLGSILSSPVVSNGVVFVGSADGTLYALQ